MPRPEFTCDHCGAKLNTFEVCDCRRPYVSQDLFVSLAEAVARVSILEEHSGSFTQSLDDGQEF